MSQSFKDKYIQTAHSSWVFPCCAGIILLAAIALTITRGNPIGQPIGNELFPHHYEHGSVIIESSVATPQLTDIARWGNEYMQALTLRFDSKAPRIRVRLLADKSSYITYGLTYIRGFNKNMDFCYSPSERTVYGYQTDTGLKSRLRHELFHGFAEGKRLNNLPLWFEEGVAELMESYQLHNGDLVLRDIQEKRLRIAGYQALKGDLTPIKLSTLNRSQWYGPDAGINYSVAYAFALYLDRNNQLLEAIDKGVIHCDPEDYTNFTTSPQLWRGGLGELDQRLSLHKHDNTWAVPTKAVGNHHQ